LITEIQVRVRRGGKNKTKSAPREKYSLFLLTRFIDALERLAHALSKEACSWRVRSKRLFDGAPAETKNRPRLLFHIPNDSRKAAEG
jgi:hypothetical protein